MNKDHVEGVAEKAKGKINKKVGKMTNDPTQESRAMLDRSRGKCARTPAT
jgi:uncharacterized protein YjbJ (UPF0337 family)